MGLANRLAPRGQLRPLLRSRQAPAGLALAPAGEPTPLIAPVPAPVGPPPEPIGPRSKLVDSRKALVALRQALVAPRNELIASGNTLFAARNGLLGFRKELFALGTELSAVDSELSASRKAHFWHEREPFAAKKELSRPLSEPAHRQNELFSRLTEDARTPFPARGRLPDEPASRRNDPKSQKDGTARNGIAGFSAESSTVCYAGQALTTNHYKKPLDNLRFGIMICPQIVSAFLRARKLPGFFARRMR